jgi:hypothetical protein
LVVIADRLFGFDFFEIDVFSHCVFGLGRIGPFGLWSILLRCSCTLVHIRLILHIPELLPDVPGRTEYRQNESKDKSVKQVNHNSQEK